MAHIDLLIEHIQVMSARPCWFASCSSQAENYPQL